MRYMYLTILLAIGSLSFGQGFPQDSTMWLTNVYHGMSGMAESFYGYMSRGDTIIGAENYRKMYRIHYCKTNPMAIQRYQEFDGDTVYFGALRSTSDEVYFKAWNLTSEVLLMDFNLNVGDSIDFYNIQRLTGEATFQNRIPIDSKSGAIGSRAMGYASMGGSGETWIENHGAHASFFNNWITEYEYISPFCTSHLDSADCLVQCEPAGGDLAYNYVDYLYGSNCPPFNPNVNITNAGVDTVYSIDFGWEYGASTYTSPMYTWTGLLPPGQTQNIVLPMNVMTEQCGFSYYAWPNGSWDVNDTNNGGPFDIWPYELPYIDACVVDTSFDLVDVVLIASGTPGVTSNLNMELFSWSFNWLENYDFDGNLTDTLCLSKGCYRDAWIGVSPVDGSVTFDLIELSSGDTLISYSDDSATYYTFCIDAILSADEVNEEEMQAFPNPSSGMFNLNGILTNDKLEVYNSTGALVLKSTGARLVDLTSCPNGLYHARIMSEQSSRTIKLMKQ